MQDKDDMVQKGYRWLLKVAGKLHEQAVFDFTVTCKQLLTRTALLEKRPAELKAKAMVK